MYYVDGTTFGMTRGDDAILKIEFTNSDNAPYRPAAGESLKLRIKPSAASATVLLECPEISDGRFYIAKEDTASWEYGSYAYVIVLVKTDNTEETLFGPHVFKVEQEVTY